MHVRLIVGVLVLAACNGKGDDSAGGESDADTDTDTDSDTDSDTDVDWTSIEGSLTYEFEVNGEMLCDAVIEFTGTPYAGLCPDCDFLFEVEATLTKDAGNGACPFVAPLSLYDTSAKFGEPVLLGFAAKYSYYGDTYIDALIAGYVNDYPWGSYGPYLRPLSGGSHTSGVASTSGDAFAWTLAVGGAGSYKKDFEYYVFPYYLSTCSYYYDSKATGPYAAGNTTYASLPCAYGYLDTFAFEGSTDGNAYITVDTTSDSPALDPAMWVYGPDSCTEKYADDNFSCSLGAHDCPSLAVATEAGEYLIVVEQSSSCGGSGGLADYRLDIDASWDPKVTQIDDDVQNPGPAELTITGTATLTK